MINSKEFDVELMCSWCIQRTIKSDYELSIPVETRIEAKNLRSKLDDPDLCHFCKGIISKSLNLKDKLVKKLQSYQFESFETGVQLHKALNQQDRLSIEEGLMSKSLRSQIALELNYFLATALNKQVDHDDPQITVLINAKRKNPRFELQIRSIYILGRYNKLARGIPQTKWPCTHCKGRGCRDCSNTGQQYPNTVEKLVSEPFYEISGTHKTSFHGAGREDIDALMLGDGRPFVLELKNPKTRFFNLGSIQEEINKSKLIQVNSMQFTDKKIIKFIKAEAANTRKIYRAKVKLAFDPNTLDLNKLRDFGQQEQIIQQRTPVRVSHRRSDLIREKRIYSVAISHDDEFLELEIEAQGGAYIKEFISGDGGRTIPSISSILGTESTCIELDVIAVDQKGLFSN